MIYSIYEDSTAARCLGIIERNAAKFMRIGGGSLSGSNRKPASAAIPVSADAKARILELAGGGVLCVTAIARRVGVSQSAAFKIVERAGMRTPDGRRRQTVVLH